MGSSLPVGLREVNRHGAGACNKNNTCIYPVVLTGDLEGKLVGVMFTAHVDSQLLLGETL